MSWCRCEGRVPATYQGSCRQQVLYRLALFLEFLKRLLEAILAEGIEFYAFDNSVALAIAPAGVTEDEPFGNAVLALRDHRRTGQCFESAYEAGQRPRTGRYWYQAG